MLVADFTCSIEVLKRKWKLLKYKVLVLVRTSLHPAHNINPFSDMPNGREYEIKFTSLLHPI